MFYFYQKLFGQQKQKLLRNTLACSLITILLSSAVATAKDRSFTQLQQEYGKTTSALVEKYCLECHSTEDREGELDLERFSSFDRVRHDPQAWQKVAVMLGNGEMPPEESPQPSLAEKTLLRDWVQRYLSSEAQANAGDPGSVVLRRLNNAEYTYTIRDLTSVALSPTLEFPADGAAGEGFTNTGGAQAMSPSMVAKYLDASKGVANHLVLLPDGFRFSAYKSRRDWTNEILGSIREMYFRYAGNLGDASALNRWDGLDPTKLTKADGRVDLEAYFKVLIQYRNRFTEDTSFSAEIAQSEGLSAVYLRHLAEMLMSEESSVLLDRVRLRWLSAEPDDARAMAEEIRAWQGRLWKFNPVGHYGQVNGWQEPVTPLSGAESFRVKLEPKPEDSEVAIYLVSGSAGGGNDSDRVVWKRPRIERPGRPPLLLRDLRAASFAISQKRDAFLANVSRYFSAARDAKTTSGSFDLSELAETHDVDSLVLESWLNYLGIAYSGETVVQEYLDSALTKVAGFEFVKGWGVAGQSALSLVANSSDEQAKLPGDLDPHKIAVHPRPERWVAVGWRSPVAGRVKIVPQVKDAHPQCGNGVSWSLELGRGGNRRVLASGNLDMGEKATIEPLDEFLIEAGDLVSLVISARDKDHGCDLTEIELDINELDGEQRKWSLSGDCADSVDASNPHADQHGNPTVWHFYTGRDRDGEKQPTIPADSKLAKWLTEKDTATAEQIAAEIQSLLSSPLPGDAAAAEAELYRQLTALDGPLFSHIDTVALADSMAAADLANVNCGLDPEKFVSLPDDVAQRAENLVVAVPSIIEVKIPVEFATDGELVVSGSLASNVEGDASAQFLVTTKPPADANTLLPGAPVVVHSGSTAEKRFQKAFDEFRSLFPAAMCYSRIVPVDVGVTLVLFYREDEQLTRLMFSDEERTTLDRLWDELHFVNQDALALVTGFEQLLEFATQDDDPSKYLPLGESIHAAADAFRTRLVNSESHHLDTLVDFSSRAYRRPLEAAEEDLLRQLYAQLRAEKISHDEALRLTLARVLTSPAFLYRLERPQQGPERSLVSDFELANRLSYFLWSSAPDRQLFDAATNGLSDPATIITETRRMVQDQRVRRLAIEFACQWLHIRNFDKYDEKSDRHFPTFADLRDDMYEESIRFFTDLFQNDGSVLDILDADHTFLNEALATHYGIPGVEGEAWRRVAGVREYARGGILAQATTLASQAGASRNSLILRGNWISETLLGERLPRPPKDVPVLPETVPADLTERQLIEQHSSDPSCAKCHARIDPYGIALEGFDAIGRFREKDSGGHEIDTRSTLLDGTEIDGIEELRTYFLTTRREDFVRHFCRKLLGYALGRTVQLSDEPLLDEMLRRLAANDYHISQALETIVTSDQFRMIRGRDYQAGVLTETETTR